MDINVDLLQWFKSFFIKRLLVLILQIVLLLQVFNCKQDKICIDKGSKFYNRSIKSWLQDNDTEMLRDLLKP